MFRRDRCGAGPGTEWGRQFWRITGPYFSSRDSWRPWALILALLFLTILGVRILVLLSYQGNEMYTSLQLVAQALEAVTPRHSTVRSRCSGVRSWFSLCWPPCTWCGRLLAQYTGQALEILWRTWLTDRVTTDGSGDGRA
ncbi:hypothetical protein GS934_18860 [Rhodococcus hoagii]|nr:hypothetical protein [Prescottella equi]NKZ88317.1 hypothetical protein [Prescottella equi]